MPSIRVDSRIFVFEDDWLVMKYDDTPYYQHRFKGVCRGTRKGGMSAVDLIAMRQSGHEHVLYLIESKDYRNSRREKALHPADEFTKKVLDTLSGVLPTVLCSETSEDGEDVLREQMKSATGLRLVFQFEQPQKPSKLFPRPFDPADIQAKIRGNLRAIDPHALVIDRSNQTKVNWTVRDY